MKYILRTLWLIGYIPVFIFECIIFLIMIFVYPLAGAFYFIKTGSCENCPFIPPSLYIYIDKKYKELLKHNGYLSDNVEPTDYNSIDPHFGNPVDNVEPKFKIGDTMRTLQEAADGYTDGMPVVISVDKEYYRCTNELIAIKDQDDYEFPPMNRIQTHTDKVEPKFKVGDWCIDNEDGIIFQIVKVLDKTYRYRTNEGKEYSCARYSLELDARLWNISDTKEGDVLVDSLGNVCIYQEPSTKLMYHSHCYGNHKYFIYMGGSHEIVGSYPATKEQCDKLEKAMADAGYKWDEEKKKLKKIEQKPTWGEEDVAMLDDIIDFFENGTVKLQHDLSLYASWLKSLKDRYVWKPSDEQMATLEYYMHALVATKHKEVMFGLYQDLKKLKE